MNRSMRFGSRRRRPLAGLGASYGFLRPPRRHEEDQRLFLEHVRSEPRLRREYRTSLLVQLVVVGALLVTVIGLGLQAAVLVRRLRIPGAASLGWFVPAVVAFLALAVLRRFLRLWSDWRQMGRDAGVPPPRP